MFILAHDTEGRPVLINPAHVLFARPGPIYPANEAGSHLVMTGTKLELGDSFEEIVRALCCREGKYVVPA